MKQTPEQRAEARWKTINQTDHPDIFRENQLGIARIVHATCIREEVEPLEQWKESAIRVMREWDFVWQELGHPGTLSESSAAASLAEVKRLRALIQRFVDHNAKWLGKGCLEADIEWGAIVADCHKQGFVPTNTEDNG